MVANVQLAEYVADQLVHGDVGVEDLIAIFKRWFLEDIRIEGIEGDVGEKYIVILNELWCCNVGFE